MVLQANKPYPQQHKLPVKSLQVLGLEVPRPIQAIARSMASDLASQAVPLEAGFMPGSQGEALHASAPAPTPFADAENRQGNPEAHQMEYANPAGPSRLHELLTPSQALALGEQSFQAASHVRKQASILHAVLKTSSGLVLL